MLKRSAAILLASITLVLGACSDDEPVAVEDASSESEPDATSTTAPHSSSSSASSCEADDADPGELESLIIDDVPEGFTPEPDSVGDTGPSDLAKAVRDDGSDDAEDTLTELRFRRGYQRLWTNDAEDELIVFLYEFCDAAGAREYADRSVDEYFGVDPSFESFEVSGIEGARGFASEEEGEGYIAILVGRGTFDIQIVAYGSQESASIEQLIKRAETVAKAQAAAVKSA